MSSAQPISVVIVGAGLGGLLLARVLHVRSQSSSSSSDSHTQLQLTVLEGDASEDARSQGGLLDIHDNTGQIALQAAGLLSNFAHIAHLEGEATRIADMQANIRLDHPVARGVLTDAEKSQHGDVIIPGRPECDRGQLRKMLICSLPKEMVRWGSKVAKVETATDGADGDKRSRITLETGETIEADIVVGADGAWSRVRPLLSSSRPIYTGMTYVQLRVHDIDQTAPDVAELVGNGMFMALAPRKGIFVHRTYQGHLHTYACITVPEQWISEKRGEFADVDVAKKDLCAMYSEWAPIYRTLIMASASHPGCAIRPLYTLPPDHRWAHRSGVTLIGDAAHLMPGGAGANVAMQDGAELAVKISEAFHPSPSSSRGDILAAIDTAIASFESAMFSRASAAAERSGIMMEKMFAEDAPQRIVDFFQKAFMGQRDALGGKSDK